LIKSDAYGSTVFNLEIFDHRLNLFKALINKDNKEDELKDKLDFLENADSGTQEIFARYTEINDILDDEVKQYLPYFVDWVMNRVVLFEIVVPAEHEAHKVFVTMNDRGLKLSPIDMLKGFLLSRIQNSSKHATAHNLWVETSRQLNLYEKDEDANFLKTWLRAKYAKDMGGKEKNDEKGDFEIIGKDYHRWVHDKREEIGLKTNDDYQDFVLEKYKKYSTIYLKLLEFSDVFDEEYPHVFYNAAKNITLQNMLILAAIKADDSDSVVDRKIKLVSTYLDIFTTTRVLNYKKNTYDNLKDILFNLAIRIRDQEMPEIIKIFQEEYEKLGYGIDSIDSFSYINATAQDLLHILARIGEYLEQATGQTNKVGFKTYIDRKKGNNTFDIEHIFAENYNIFRNSTPENENDFENEKEFSELRNLIGALVLLPRSRNRSLKEQSYSSKLSKYSVENILAQSLSKNFYENNKFLRDALNETKLDLKPYETFNKKTMTERQRLYKEIAHRIWDITLLN